jgi:hypothetical protein
VSASERKELAAKKAEELTSATGGWQDFVALGDPPIDDPDTILEYARKTLAVTLGQVCRDKKLPRLTRWRFIREITAALGMTHNRGKIESRTKKLEATMVERKQSAAIQVVDGSTVEIPETARGGRRGPRPVKGEPDDGQSA